MTQNNKEVLLTEEGLEKIKSRVRRVENKKTS